MRILITSIVDLKRSYHNRLHWFIEHLSKNHDITVLSINDWWKANQVNAELCTQGFGDDLGNVSTEYFTRRKISPVLQEVASAVTIGKILDKLDYKSFDVHFNYNSLISGYFVARKMKSIGIDTVYDIGDDLPAMVRSSPQIPRLLRPLGGFLGGITFRKNLDIARKVTVLGDVLRNSLKVLITKSVIVPNGVDTELFNNHPSPQLKKKLGLGQSIVLGYVGGLREWVDLEPVFAAVRELNNEKLNLKVLIVGEEGGLKKNKDLARGYGVSDRVIFVGSVPYARVPEYISCIDICLLPFKDHAVSHNALPLKLFEYMACEKSVISTSLNGVKEAVGDRVLYASSTQELKGAITQLYKSEEQRKKLGLDGRRFVKENYSWAKACSRLEEVLLEVAALNGKAVK